MRESEKQMSRDASKPPPFLVRMTRVAHEDTSGIHLRLQLAIALAALAPRNRASTLRARLLRRSGFHIGAGSTMGQNLRINGPRDLYDKLVIGKGCTIEVGCTLDLTDSIHIDDFVSIGHQAMILTSSHELGPGEHRAGPLTHAPVVVGKGTRIGARAIILPGVTIGSSAIVEPGAVVNKDVQSNTRVAGSPAKIVAVKSS
jgi:maltose O-acetyltransferase